MRGPGVQSPHDSPPARVCCCGRHRGVPAHLVRRRSPAGQGHRARSRWARPAGPRSADVRRIDAQLRTAQTGRRIRQASGRRPHAQPGAVDHHSHRQGSIASRHRTLRGGGKRQGREASGHQHHAQGRSGVEHRLRCGSPGCHRGLVGDVAAGGRQRGGGQRPHLLPLPLRSRRDRRPTERGDLPGGAG